MSPVNFQVNNSILSTLVAYSTTADLNVTNCLITSEINRFTTGVFSNNIINSGILSSTSVAYNNVFIEGNADEASINENNNKASADELFGKALSYDDKELYELTETAQTTYLGKDETQVGIYGGKTPFTPISSIPLITQMTVAPIVSIEGILNVKINLQIQGSSNNPVKYQYWFGDKDTPWQTVVNESSLLNFDLDVSSLKGGVHRFYFHSQDENGVWSPVKTQAFIKYGDDFEEPELHMSYNKVFQIFDSELTWPEAADLSKRLGGNLATVTSLEENTFLMSILESHINFDRYWLGGINRIENNKWEWQSGIPWDYENWLYSAFIDNNEEFYLVIWSKIGKWGIIDINNDTRMPMVLRVAVPDPPDKLPASYSFILEKEINNISSLTVLLPESAKDGSYKNMSLELSKGTEPVAKLTTNASTKYTFGGLSYGTYHLVLKNNYGDIVGQINDILIMEDKTVAFTSSTSVYKVSLTVTADAQNFSGKPTVKWYDTNDGLLSQGESITGLVAGTQLKYQLSFNETWGKVFALPPMQSYTVVAGNNSITLQLQKIPETTIQGTVKGSGFILLGAVVTASQWLNGKFNQVLTTKTGADGAFMVQSGLPILRA